MKVDGQVQRGLDALRALIARRDAERSKADLICEVAALRDENLRLLSKIDALRDAVRQSQALAAVDRVPPAAHRFRQIELVL